MSRIGRLPITLPDAVTVTCTDRAVTVSGVRGRLVVNVPQGVRVENKANLMVVTVDSPLRSNLQGLVRTLVYNATVGVSVGWHKSLELSGTGYRASTNGTELNLALGFSHPVVVKSPKGIAFEVTESKITVTGIDRGQVGEVAAKIRHLRPADPYKLKGLKYEGEKLIKKAGKAAKAGASGGK